MRRRCGSAVGGPRSVPMAAGVGLWVLAGAAASTGVPLAAGERSWLQALAGELLATKQKVAAARRRVTGSRPTW